MPLDLPIAPLPLESASARLERDVEAMRAHGRDVHSMLVAQSPFPVPERIVLGLREAATEKEYQPSRGLPALRRAVASYVERRVGIDRTADDVLIGPGSKDLLFTLMLAFQGEVIVPTPSWTAHRPQAELASRTLIEIATTREESYRLTPAALERALIDRPRRVRLLILNYPANPTGLSYRLPELREFADVLRRYDVLVLSDEIYGELHHKGQHVSLARAYPEGTIVSTGLSKWLGAGGWRLGAFVFPEETRPLLEAMAAIAKDTFTATASPIQHAAVVAFRGGDDIETYLANVRRILSSVGRLTARRLAAHGVQVAQPVGGLSVFADFEPFRDAFARHGIHTSGELARRMLERAHVAGLPGDAFGCDPRTLALRLAYVEFAGDKALEAVSVIPREQPIDETFVRRHAPRVLHSVERIGQFVAELTR